MRQWFRPVSSRTAKGEIPLNPPLRKGETQYPIPGDSDVPKYPLAKGGDPAVESMMRRAYDMGAKSWGAPVATGSFNYRPGLCWGKLRADLQCHSEQSEGSKVLDYIPFLDTRIKFLLKAFRFLAYGSE